MSLEDQLHRIRQQNSSKLENQKQISMLLKVVEESILGSVSGGTLPGIDTGTLTDTTAKPIALFGTLMSIVEDLNENEQLITSATYLLAIVFPYLPTTVLKLKYESIAQLFTSIITTFHDNASITKSMISCFEILLKTNYQKQELELVLSLLTDKRPKVRKRALDCVYAILSRPIPPSLVHPGIGFTIDFYTSLLQGTAEDQVLDLLVSLKVLCSLFVKNEKVVLLVEQLLKLPTSNVIVTRWVYQVLEAMLVEKLDFQVVHSMVSALLLVSPNQNDIVLCPLWLRIMQLGFTRLSEFVCDLEFETEVDQVVTEFASTYDVLLSDFFKRIFQFFKKTGKKEILTQVTILLSSLFETGVSNQMVQKELLKGMLKLVQDALTSIHFRDHWGFILEVCVAIFHRLGQDHSPQTIPILHSIMAFRDDKSYSSSFPFKKELDGALHAAVQTLGLETFLSVIPLNIEQGEPKRPYLLAIFASALQVPVITSSWVPLRILGPHTLAFYVSYFIPLADSMLKKSASLWLDGKQLEAKVYETIGLQVWSLFPLICASLPNDVAESFGLLAPHLGKILTSVPGEVYPNLPSESDLRPVVCQGLENLVESFYLLSSVMVEDTDDQVKQQWKSVCNKVGVEAITKIKTYVNRFLSALCNIYVTVDPKIGNGKATGQALQVIHEKSIQYFEKPIKKFLLIADKKAVGEYMATLVKSILEKQQGDMTVVDRLGVYAIMDLNLILLPNLDKDMVGVVEMYYQLLMDQVTTTDATLQKKTYKSLVHVVQHVGIDQINQLELSKVLLIDTKIATGAYRPRIQLIQTLVTLTKNKQLLLDFIPRVIPEIMLATKEASEKTRDGAYDCLVEMAKKMMNGADALLVGDGLDTVMQSISLTEGSADSDIEKNHKGEISIKEFMMMVAAGLTGDDVHMHSASIASMGRLLFEFHDALDSELIKEIINTVLDCMSLKNREVTKAALGFLKIAIVCLNLDLLTVSLKSMIDTILDHSGDFKSHFKSKIRHIFERLIRKFGYETIDGYFPDQHKKLIANIKKRRESLKKRKQAGNDHREQTQTQEKPKKFEEAFQDSDSDLDSDNDDYIPEQFKEETRKQKTKPLAVIREGEVVDFLDKNIVSQITHEQKQRKAVQTKFKNKDGKMVFEDQIDEEMVEEGEDYYKQSLENEMAFTRGPDGRVKFLKRKRDDDQEETVGKRWNQNPKNKREKQNIDTDQMLGRQYKAKNAKGDVKRAGMAAPHAYIPLSGKIVGNMHKSTKLDGTFKNILKAAQKGGEVGTRKKSFKGVSKQNKKHNK